MSIFYHIYAFLIHALCDLHHIGWSRQKVSWISEEDLCCAAPFAITALKNLTILDGSANAERSYLLDWKKMITRIARVVQREIVREGSRADQTTQRVHQRHVVSSSLSFLPNSYFILLTFKKDLSLKDSGGTRACICPGNCT